MGAEPRDDNTDFVLWRAFERRLLRSGGLLLERVLGDGIYPVLGASSIAIQASICHHPRGSQDRAKRVSNP
jgi:hypothetical protein